MFTLGPPMWGAAASGLADVLLQSRFEGADGGTVFVNDAVGGASLTGFGGATTSTTVKKFGSSSMKLGATSGTRVQTAEHTSLYVRNNSSFTIELFVYFTSLSGFQSILELLCDSGAACYMLINSGGTTFYWRFASGTSDSTFASSFAINTWYHLAMVNEPGVGSKMYIDGVLKQTVSNADANGSLTASQLIAGNDRTLSTFYLKGYIDSIRISRKIQYTGAFTPPSVDFSAS